MKNRAKKNVFLKRRQLLSTYKGSISSAKKEINIIKIVKEEAAASVSDSFQTQLRSPQACPILPLETFSSTQLSLSSLLALV